METFSPQIITSIAMHIQLKINLQFNDELVCLIGTGQENTNTQALCNWLQGLWGLDNYPRHPQDGLKQATQLLHNTLQAMYEQIYYREAGPLPETHTLLPAQSLSNLEKTRMARGIYHILTHTSHSAFLNSGIAILTGETNNPVQAIAAWVSGKSLTYTFYPSELTVPLASELMSKIIDIQ